MSAQPEETHTASINVSLANTHCTRKKEEPEPIPHESLPIAEEQPPEEEENREIC